MERYLIDFTNVSYETQKRVLKDIDRVSFMEPKQFESSRKYLFYLDGVSISSIPIPQECSVSEFKA